MKYCARSTMISISNRAAVLSACVFASLAMANAAGAGSLTFTLTTGSFPANSGIALGTNPGTYSEPTKPYCYRRPTICKCYKMPNRVLKHKNGDEIERSPAAPRLVGTMGSADLTLMIRASPIGLTMLDNQRNQLRHSERRLR